MVASGPASHQEMTQPLSQSSLRKALTPSLSISSLLSLERLGRLEARALVGNFPYIRLGLFQWTEMELLLDLNFVPG